MAEKRIHIFKNPEEQEMFFLKYFAGLSPGERLKALAGIQQKTSGLKPEKKIRIRKHFIYGY